MVGLSIEEARVDDFRLPQTQGIAYGLGRLSFLEDLIKDRFKSMFTLRPVPNRERCIGCGACRESCPEEAVSIINEVARIADKRCIRCYCCHEACSEKAIDLMGSSLLKTFNWLEKHGIYRR